MINEWFLRNKRVGIYSPSGWLGGGRPFEYIFTFLNVEASGDLLIINFEDNFKISFEGGEVLVEKEGCLKVSSFQKCETEWSGKRKQYCSGEVEFLAAPV